MATGVRQIPFELIVRAAEQVGSSLARPRAFPRACPCAVLAEIGAFTDGVVFTNVRRCAPVEGVDDPGLASVNRQREPAQRATHA